MLGTPADGYQLGELNQWSKKTNTELATHVPLIVRVPWLKAAVNTANFLNISTLFGAIWHPILTHFFFSPISSPPMPCRPPNARCIVLP